MGDQERVVRVRFPEDLVRRMDTLLQRRAGGMETRNEFVEEALRMLVLEHEYEDDKAREALAPSKRVSAPREGRSELNLAQGAGSTTIIAEPDLVFTELVSPSRPVLIDKGVASVEDSCLFGLHNRDYPTIWAAFQIAGLTAGTCRSAGTVFKMVIERSWDFAARLQAAPPPPGFKLTSLFPLNREKRQAAEGRFRLFALGKYDRDEETVSAEGPLFSWHLCQLSRVDDDLVIGLTPEGWTLLEQLDGISLRLPHSDRHADAFLNHLRRFSLEDWWGFQTVLTVASEGATRTTMIERFARERTNEWSQNEVSTNAQGYVARCREWGLVEPKMIASEYRLTPYGEKIAEGSLGECQ